MFGRDVMKNAHRKPNSTRGMTLAVLLFFTVQLILAPVASFAENEAATDLETKSEAVAIPVAENLPKPDAASEISTENSVVDVLSMAEEMPLAAGETTPADSAGEVLPVAEKVPEPETASGLRAAGVPVDVALLAENQQETGADDDAGGTNELLMALPDEAGEEKSVTEIRQASLQAESGNESVNVSGNEAGTDTNWTVSYDHNAELFDPESGKYPGVYAVAISPNEKTKENAETIGMPSIADKNLTEPTTESPAIIQGAALGYEEKTGPVDYKTIQERVEPFSDYTVSIMEEQGQDGTVHKKLSGFDKTYVFVRLDVSEFFNQAAGTATYLHLQQEDNRALLPGIGMADDNKAFIDQTGKKAGAYLMSDLVDKGAVSEEKPFVDIILYSSATNAAGADIGKPDMPNGDVPVQFYMDNTADYNPELKYDPLSTDPNHHAEVLKKFFDATKTVATAISSFLVKGSDLALETAVENKDTGTTTYWSLAKSLEDPFYDRPEDSSPADPNCGETVKLITEVAVTDPINLTGEDADHLKKRTLDVNSFDIQVANNTTQDQSTYTSGFTLKNGWLTIEDMSNTTGAELAIGNNARFTIDQGGKLIIDETCQLEVEWDGGTTTQPADGQPAAKPDTLNNGQLDLLAGGEIVNNGIITIEGFEGKPYLPGEQPVETEKGCGELTIAEGAVLTNNGTIACNGKLFILGTLVNNGKYDDVIVSNDPDKGQFAYHRGIQVAWKDDVTQAGVEPGTLNIGIDRNGKVYPGAQLINNGDIVLTPGILNNYGTMINSMNARLLTSAVSDAVIPIVPDPATPTIVTKRITLDPPRASVINNYGTLINYGLISPCTVEVRDDTGLGKLTIPGRFPELFQLNNYGEFYNYEKGTMVLPMANGITLFFYSDGGFLAQSADGDTAEGTYGFNGDRLIFTLNNGKTVEPVVNAKGDAGYSLPSSGKDMEFILSAAFIARLREALEAVKAGSSRQELLRLSLR